MEARSYCPYCGEPVALWLDGVQGAGEQQWIEDCSVCCRPWQVRARLDADGDATVVLQRLDD